MSTAIIAAPVEASSQKQSVRVRAVPTDGLGRPGLYLKPYPPGVGRRGAISRGTSPCMLLGKQHDDSTRS
ncbi:hypothetical protein HBI81_166110 [Parastagonospora nodorum]|nr:hypothetical protein HBI68_221370 [Parastagonospora nodorum]KAH6383540.1 hypothetical protein HBI08_212940 [Parastagonospora nodorum]KAH6519933.1 hypothetical protein HBI81_166110 [Parastagonospora nodorum]